MEDLFVCKPRSEVAPYDFMSHAENGVISVTKAEIGTVNSSDTGQRSYSADFVPSIGQNLPYGSAESFPSHGAKFAHK